MKPSPVQRALATGRKQWPEIRWSVIAPEIPFARYAPDEAALLPEIEWMVGDLQRLLVYAQRGDQAPTEVPEEIRAAWRRLVAAGFGKYVL